ncbi:hypothetical protein XENORESO_018986 [Xenotaenia resolanae]|uniref:Uncharacterized protein n=1 Tax=Xenotaenia resolanae TaxID=208358 RepID=A0ABV0WMK7_9TELE
MIYPVIVSLFLDPLRKLFRLVGVGFGLLCILQAALNVSLRLTLFKIDTQPSTTETVCRNETDNQRPLIGKCEDNETHYGAHISTEFKHGNTNSM